MAKEETRMFTLYFGQKYAFVLEIGAKFSYLRKQKLD